MDTDDTVDASYEVDDQEDETEEPENDDSEEDSETEEEKLAEEPAEGNLFPGMEIPEGIENLALEMKKAEIIRKKQQSIEKDKREELCELMEHLNFRRFQLDIDGICYEFELEEKAKVKSKKLKKEEE